MFFDLVKISSISSRDRPVCETEGQHIYFSTYEGRSGDFYRFRETEIHRWDHGGIDHGIDDVIAIADSGEADRCYLCD